MWGAQTAQRPSADAESGDVHVRRGEIAARAAVVERVESPGGSAVRSPGGSAVRSAGGPMKALRERVLSIIGFFRRREACPGTRGGTRNYANYGGEFLDDAIRFPVVRPDVG